MRTRSLSLALLVLGLTLPAARGADKVTLDDLLKQMTDLSLLAEYPDPPYVTKQFSSYDRASEAPGKESWFANADRGFMLYDGVVKEKTAYFKTEPTREGPEDGSFAAGTKVGFSPTHKRVGNFVWVYATAADGRAIDGKIPQGYIDKEAVTPEGHVLAEMDGPGCVVNIWSADPDDAGKIHIYLDEAKDPVIEAPLAELLGGKWKTTIDGKETTPFPDPIACERSRGFNLYFPIAYAKHCKITVDKPDLYYHVDYRTYSKRTEVETFTVGELAEKRNEVAGVADARRGPNRFVGKPDKVSAVGAAIRPKGRYEGFAVGAQGGSAVQLEVGLKVEHDEDLPLLLRGAVLNVTFDGAADPQIQCPLGDFFGSGPGLNPYSSLPFQASREGGQVNLRSTGGCRTRNPRRSRCKITATSPGS